MASSRVTDLAIAGAAVLLGCASSTGVGRAGDRYERCDDALARRALESARTAIVRGDDDVAYPHLRTVVERCPDYVPGHLLLVETAQRLGGEADEQMRALYLRHDDPSSPVGPYVDALLASDDEARVTLLDLALRRNRSFYYAYQAKADIWRRLQRTSQALEELQKAIAAKPDFAPANLALAEVLQTLGRSIEAARYYENYVELRPGDRGAKKASVELLLYGLERPADAAPWIEDLLQTDPDDVEVLMDRAALAWFEGDVQRAAELYFDVLERDPDQPRAVLNLGNLYYDALPRSDAERKTEYWTKARLAYRYFIALNEPKGMYDVWDRYLSVPLRLKRIDAELGPLADGVVVELEDLR